MIAWIAILLTALYALLFFYYWLGWNSTPLFDTKDLSNITFTVIVPARNEEKNIGMLLQSLMSQNYPRALYEVIVVDDHSDDQTASIASAFDVTVIPSPNTSNSFKKKAIESAIQIAKGEYIITTDADCVADHAWLSTFASYIQLHQPIFVAAPVDLKGDGSLLHSFQELDFAMMQGITCASITQQLHAMSNGANLLYKKTAFYDVGGFSGIDHVASGDDMLLMERMQKIYPDRIHYLKSQNCIVRTEPQHTWQDFFNQRTRWASKSSHYKDAFLTGILVFVYAYNLWLVILATMAGFQKVSWSFVLIAILAKILIELPLLVSVLDFFKKIRKVLAFPFLQPLHIIYIVVAGVFSLRKTYMWKGRRVQ